MIVLVSLVAVACESKKKHGITYEEISHVQSVADLTAAFAEEGEKIEVEREIDDFFTRLGKATMSSKSFDLESYISVDAMIETAEAAGAFRGMGVSDKREFIKGLRKGFSQAGENFRQIAYDRHRIVRVEKPAENRRIVFATLYSSDLNITNKMRMWLVKTDDGWRIHDFEDMSMGLRSIGLITTMMKAGLGKKQEPWIADFLPVMNMIKQIDPAQPESISKLREPLERFRSHTIPNDLKRFASVMMVACLMSDGEMDEAEKELQAAETGGYASPLFHYQKGHLMMAREEWRMALDEFEKHIGIMGADSDILESVSECHYRLDDISAAREAALKGLEDNPQATSCLLWFAATSSAEQMNEPGFAAKFDAVDDPALVYENAMDLVLILEDAKQAKILFAYCRGKLVDDESVDYYEEMIAEMEDP